MAATEADCKHEAGTFMPQINRNRCDGKEACVKVCPYNVFTMGVLPPQDRKALSFMGKFKSFAHGWKQAFTTNADACHACGLCVAACPEKAIKLVRAE